MVDSQAEQSQSSRWLDNHKQYSEEEEQLPNIDIVGPTRGREEAPEISAVCSVCTSRRFGNDEHGRQTLQNCRSSDLRGISHPQQADVQQWLDTDRMRPGGLNNVIQNEPRNRNFEFGNETNGGLVCDGEPGQSGHPTGSDLHGHHMQNLFPTVPIKKPSDQAEYNEPAPTANEARSSVRVQREEKDSEIDRNRPPTDLVTVTKPEVRSLNNPGRRHTEESNTLLNDTIIMRLLVVLGFSLLLLVTIKMLILLVRDLSEPTSQTEHHRLQESNERLEAENAELRRQLSKLRTRRASHMQSLSVAVSVLKSRVADCAMQIDKTMAFASLFITDSQKQRRVLWRREQSCMADLAKATEKLDRCHVEHARQRDHEVIAIRKQVESLLNPTSTVSRLVIPTDQEVGLEGDAVDGRVVGTGSLCDHYRGLVGKLSSFERAASERIAVIAQQLAKARAEATACQTSFLSLQADHADMFAQQQGAFKRRATRRPWSESSTLKRILHIRFGLYAAGATRRAAGVNDRSAQSRDFSSLAMEASGSRRKSTGSIRAASLGSRPDRSSDTNTYMFSFLTAFALGFMFGRTDQT